VSGEAEVRERNMRPSLPLFLFLTILFIAAGCSPLQLTDEPTPTPMPTAVKPTFIVQRGNIVIKTMLGGRVVSAQSKPVSFAIGGTVSNVYVQVGDYVEQGQLLADLEALKELEQQWAEASVQANYEETISNNTIKRAELKLQIAQLTVDDLRAGGASATAIQIAELQVQLAHMDLDEVKANPVLHQAAAKAKELEQAMADAQLKAPVAGYIVEASKPGQTALTTAAAFQIGDTRQLEMGANAMEEDLKQLVEGMTVTVAFESRPNDVFTGTIRQLPYPYGRGTGSDNGVRVTLRVSPEQGQYKLGDRVNITAVLQDKQDILWLPPQAIRAVGGRTFVVLQDGQKRVDITLGLQTHDRVEILGGLSEGQVVRGP